MISSNDSQLSSWVVSTCLRQRRFFYKQEERKGQGHRRQAAKEPSSRESPLEWVLPRPPSSSIHLVLLFITEGGQEATWDDPAVSDWTEAKRGNILGKQKTHFSGSLSIYWNNWQNNLKYWHIEILKYWNIELWADQIQSQEIVNTILDGPF